MSAGSVRVLGESHPYSAGSSFLELPSWGRAQQRHVGTLRYRKYI